MLQFKQKQHLHLRNQLLLLLIISPPNTQTHTVAWRCEWMFLGKTVHLESEGASIPKSDSWKETL